MSDLRLSYQDMLNIVDGLFVEEYEGQYLTTYIIERDGKHYRLTHDSSRDITGNVLAVEVHAEQYTATRWVPGPPK